MIQAASSNYFFFSVLLTAMILAILIFLPFLAPLVLAMALAVIFVPMHRRILKLFFGGKEKSSLGALVTILVIAVIVFVPLFLISVKAYGEVRGMYAFFLDESGRAQTIDVLDRGAQSLSKLFFGLYPDYSFESFNIVSVVDGIAQWSLSHFNTIFASLSKLAISFFVMCLALFYFLRDGNELKRQLISLSPLENVDDEHIFAKLQQAVRSIFAGSITVGIIQGILTGVGFALFHVPNPALWGAVAALAALIPGIGTSLVLVPAILYLYFNGYTGQAIGLSVWGVLAVGLIDNFLGPLLINRGIKIHPFIILLSVLGGIIFFGPIGFVLGPLVLALLFSLLEIYRSSRARA
jgi:predicted PurR-regulated permease PerM